MLPPSSRSHVLTTTGAAILAVSFAASISGCSALAKIQNQPVQADYTSWADAASADGSSGSSTGGDSNGGNPAWSPPPAFVPHDAVNIYVRTLDGVGSILTYTSVDTLDAALCAPGVLTGKPRLDYNWWPVGHPPATGEVCAGGWQVFTVDGISYGWR